MFCSKCGFELPDDVAFCARCGNKITVRPEKAVETAVSPVTKQITEDALPEAAAVSSSPDVTPIVLTTEDTQGKAGGVSSKKKSSRTKVIVAVALAFLVLLIVPIVVTSNLAGADEKAWNSMCRSALFDGDSELKQTLKEADSELHVGSYHDDGVYGCYFSGAKGLSMKSVSVKDGYREVRGMDPTKLGFTYKELKYKKGNNVLMVGVCKDGKEGALLISEQQYDHKVIPEGNQMSRVNEMLGSDVQINASNSMTAEEAAKAIDVALKSAGWKEA